MPNYPQRICAVVLANERTEFLQNLKVAQQHADYVELRIDYLPPFNLHDLKAIRKQVYKPAIFCCRAQAEGGQFQGTTAQQNNILQQANDLGFDYLDIDVELANIIQIKNKKSKIILSYHNFEITPDLNDLQSIAEQMRFYKPDIFKFAVMINNFNDAKILLQFLLNKKNSEEMIMIGMGEHGKIIRLLAPFLGSYLTFASVNDNESAPGQIDVSEMRNLYQQISKLLV